jgi:hypothetical protein
MAEFDRLAEMARQMAGRVLAEAGDATRYIELRIPWDGDRPPAEAALTSLLLKAMREATMGRCVDQMTFDHARNLLHVAEAKVVDQEQERRSLCEKIEWLQAQQERDQAYVASMRHELDARRAAAAHDALKSEGETARLKQLLSNIHHALGGRPSHGPSADAACIIDWIADAKRASASRAKRMEELDAIVAAVRELSDDDP